jgi:hypothetical protein
MVEYENGTSVDVGNDVSIVVSSKIQDVTKPESKDQQGEGEDGYGTIQLWESVFGSDLTKDTEAVKDDFGRPSHTWNYQGEDVGTYSDDADETFVTEKDFASVAAAIADYNKDYTVAGDAYVNGVKGDKAIPAGTTVELTVSKKNVTYVVASYYQLMQITGVETEVLAKDAEEGVGAYVTIDGINNTINDVDIPGFEADTYVEEAYIAVCTDGAKVLDSYVPETKQGEITKFSKDSVFVDSTAYYMAGKETTYVAGDAVAGDTVDLYLDKEGNALGTIVAKSADAEVQYGILTDVSVKASNSIKDMDDESYAAYTKKIKEGTYIILDAEGNEKNFVLSDDAKAGFDEDADAASAQIASNIMRSVYWLYYEQEGVMIEYTLNEDGELDTMRSYDYDGQLNKTNMNSKGIMDQQVVNKDVVVFAYDDEEEAWLFFDYDDLAAAPEKSISGYYFINDEGMAAIWASEG